MGIEGDDDEAGALRAAMAESEAGGVGDQVTASRQAGYAWRTNGREKNTKKISEWEEAQRIASFQLDIALPRIHLTLLCDTQMKSGEGHRPT